MTTYGFPDPADLPEQDALPDPRLRLDGTRIQSADAANPHALAPSQRAYLKAMLAHYQYGHMPPKPADLVISVQRVETVLEGMAVCIWLVLHVAPNRHAVDLRLNIVLPIRSGPFPVVIKNDRCLLLTSEGAASGESASRAAVSDNDILPEVVKRGYGVCKFLRTDLAPDQPDSRGTGVFPLYPDYDWGTIAAWAWGYQLVIDALALVPYVDLEKLVATGHSRGGKTALCAAIYDERIAIAAPNSSGTGGTGSLRIFEPGREPHQTLSRHIGAHDYWWVPRFLDFAGLEDRLPFDAHTAKALVAPRGFVNTHARQDYWANPYGTQVTHDAAREIYDRLGAADNIAIHWREGGHAQSHEDWRALLDFADHYFEGEPLAWPLDACAYTP